MLPSPISEGDPIGGISRLAKMRKPQCTGVHEDFRIKRNAEITLLRHPLIAALHCQYPARGDDKSLVFRYICEQARG